MKKGFRSATLALAALVALALAATANAAYNTAKLQVTYAGSTTRIVASSGIDDDATARAAIVIPNGTTITAAAPGTKVGSARAVVSALALAGAQLPLTGDVIVAPPGAVPAASQTACIGPVVPQATLLLQLSLAGVPLNLPAYVVANAGTTAALGASSLVFCLSSPYIPVAQGGAANGAKFVSADLTLTGVFSPVTSGAWIGIWTPWTAGGSTINSAGTVASPAVIAPGSLTLTGKKVKGAKTLAGKVSQGGIGFAAQVGIWGAVGKAAFKRIATVNAGQTGAFKYVAKKTAKQTSFQARVVVPGRGAPALCQTSPFSSLPVPCVNATVNGFAATSKSVTVR